MHNEVINFWFEEVDQKQWWSKDDSFDQLILSRFSQVHEAARKGELFEWRSSADGRLAEIIVLDQFSRNMYRDLPDSFAFDAMALVLAQEAIALGADLELEEQRRSFLYMPYMHSESLPIHDVALKLFKEKASESSLRFEQRHRDIIVQFGRYPHRNSILGRESTIAEIEFLKKPGSGF